MTTRLATHKRVALVTGAAQGIGLAVAIELLRDDHRHVVLSDLRTPDLANLPEPLRNRATAIQLDVSSRSDCTEAIDRLQKTHGGIGILVNNAGISVRNPHCTTNGVLDARPEDVSRMFDVNVMAMLHLCQLVIPGMKAQHWGRIVNVSSLAGRSKSLVAGPGYMLTKAAVLGLSRSIAAEMAQYGITTNCVAPGRILTELAQRAGEAVNKHYASEIPVKRIGEPIEVAAAIRYLCSEEAGFTNGAVIDINGGYFMS